MHTLDDVYRFEPVPPRPVGMGHAARVIGTQANLWTEVAENRGRVDYQAFPWVVAFTDVAWSDLPAPDVAWSDLPAPNERDFDDFEHWMNAAHYARLDALDVAHRPPDGPRPWQQRPGIPGRPQNKPLRTWRMA
ncbi:family 20 glycosylhydrolase [Nonomuraea angiospora]|uniref:Glycoside hydrolase family 20 catalytic domain-containing protein n=1 Tax=Nonomuraea angiospora TaxID=46172 RepID=A0ABR9MB14_9ACTN|nr:family 20 glycosylhydrolase [Nonomuraea angiospora]MBE1589692.1 hypothetical protein [Nonomuraea angiospora]